MVPTSAMTGEGMGNLMALIVELTQSMMAKRLAFSEELQATVLEVYYSKIYNLFICLSCIRFTLKRQVCLEFDSSSHEMFVYCCFNIFQHSRTKNV